MASPKSNLIFSGHETFVCRYAWLPKAIRELAKDPGLFQNDDTAMVALGVGKNMVRSIRFWADIAQIIAQNKDGTYFVTSFGQELLGHDGYDPFLENTRTLWLLHWKIATNPTSTLFYWHQLLNFWHRAEFSESEILPFFRKSIASSTSLRSENTLESGYRVFVNTYSATRGRKGEVAEDNLDSPFVELDLVRRIGDRRVADQGLRETIYAFNLDDKPAVTSALFAYSLHDFWSNTYPGEKTLPFRTITAAPGSPGQIFKIPEQAVRQHLDMLKDISEGAYTFEESASLQQAHAKKAVSTESLLARVYNAVEEV